MALNRKTLGSLETQDRREHTLSAEEKLLHSLRKDFPYAYQALRVRDFHAPALQLGVLAPAGKSLPQSTAHIRWLIHQDPSFKSFRRFVKVMLLAARDFAPANITEKALSFVKVGRLTGLSAHFNQCLLEAGLSDEQFSQAEQIFSQLKDEMAPHVSDYRGERPEGWNITDHFLETIHFEETIELFAYRDFLREDRFSVSPDNPLQLEALHYSSLYRWEVLFHGTVMPFLTLADQKSPAQAEKFLKESQEKKRQKTPAMETLGFDYYPEWRIENFGQLIDIFDSLEGTAVKDLSQNTRLSQAAISRVLEKIIAPFVEGFMREISQSSFPVGHVYDVLAAHYSEYEDHEQEFSWAFRDSLLRRISKVHPDLVVELLQLLVEKDTNAGSSLLEHFKGISPLDIEEIAASTILTKVDQNHEGKLTALFSLLRSSLRRQDVVVALLNNSPHWPPPVDCSRSVKELYLGNCLTGIESAYGIALGTKESKILVNKLLPEVSETPPPSPLAKDDDAPLEFIPSFEEISEENPLRVDKEYAATMTDLMLDLSQNAKDSLVQSKWLLEELQKLLELDLALELQIEGFPPYDVSIECAEGTILEQSGFDRFTLTQTPNGAYVSLSMKGEIGEFFDGFHLDFSTGELLFQHQLEPWFEQILSFGIYECFAHLEHIEEEYDERIRNVLESILSE